MIETISQYIDIEILLLIFIAIISFVVLNFLYKKVSMPKTLQILLSLIVIVGNIYLVYSYMDKVESNFTNTSNQYYIRGNVKFVSDAIDKIRIEYTDTNIIIEKLKDKKIIVNVSKATRVYDKNGKQISLNQIKNGDYIFVKTKRGSLQNGTNEITATSIQVK